MEGHYITPVYKTTITTAWNTKNIVKNSLLLQNFDILPGLKMSLESYFNATTGAKDGKVAGEYRGHMIALTGDVDINPSGPTVCGSAVFSHGQYTAGCQLAYDTASSTLTKQSFGLVAKLKDFVIFANMKDNEVFGGSVYVKVTPSLECGLALGRTAAAFTTLDLGANCQLNEDASLRAKVNKSMQLGLGYSQRLC